jgi:hypothetical protein
MSRSPVKNDIFLLLFLVNPLPLTILNIMSMTVVAIGCHLSLTIGPQQVIIMVISMILMILRFGDVTAWEICTNFKFQASVFSIHHGKHIFLVAADPVCHFFSLQCFQSTLIHQGRWSRKGSIEKELYLMEKSLRGIKITNGLQDQEGTFQTRTKRTRSCELTISQGGTRNLIIREFLEINFHVTFPSKFGIVTRI